MSIGIAGLGYVHYHDPHVAELPQYGLRSGEPAAAEADLAVIVMAHPSVETARLRARRACCSTCAA